MIIWKSTCIKNIIDIKNTNIQKTDNNEIYIKIADFGTHSLQVFISIALDLKPSEKHPELMGCDWILESVSNIEELKFKVNTINYIIDEIKSSKNLNGNKDKYVTFDPTKIVLPLHENEITLSQILNKDTPKMYRRMNKNRLEAKPYLKRLEDVASFLNYCIAYNVSYKIASDSDFDTQIHESLEDE